MKNRHKVHRAAGGGVFYAGGGSKVAKEAKESKTIGGLKGMPVAGSAMKANLGRPGRKRGGRVGADKAPLSSAAKISKLPQEASGGA